MINLKHFQQLAKDRKDSLRLLQKKSMRGIRDSIVEKYSEPAHFIYELLQNADDVQATQVRLVLRQEGLFFIHNGTIPFSVTAPNRQPVGHINAITSIGNSSKSDSSNTIGKFGVGFKSVFQYTTTPHIYDPNIAFKISDFIVPEILDEKTHPLKEKDETLFYFPFDNPNKIAQVAYQEIVDKIESLQHPLLFLRYLKKIDWQVQNKFGYFEIKENITTKQDIKTTYVKNISTKDKTKTQRHFLKFERKEATKNLAYSIVFLLDENQALSSVQNDYLYCYFPTKVANPFAFLIHAPFLLTDSREGIKVGEEWNQQLLLLCAQLLADALDSLKEKGLLTSEAFAFLPYEENKLSSLFRIFYKCFLQKVQSTELLPTADNEYVDLTNAYLAESPSVLNIFSPTQLAQLIKNDKAQWIFPTLKSGTPLWNFVKNKLTADFEKFDRSGNIKEVSNGVLTMEYLVRRMDADFVVAQSDDWLKNFYKEMLERHRALWSGEKALLRYLPILRRSDGEVTAAYDAETIRAMVWLPTASESPYPTIKKALADDIDAFSFFQNLGLSTPAVKDELQEFILPKYQNDTVLSAKDCHKDFEKIMQYYRQATTEQAEQFLEEIRKLPFLVGTNSIGHQKRCCAEDLYYGNELLKTFFDKNESIYLLDARTISPDEKENDFVITFLKKLGLRFFPSLLASDNTLNDEEKVVLRQGETPEMKLIMWDEVADYDLEGLSFFLSQGFTFNRSLALWQLLFSIPEIYFQDKKNGTYTYQAKAQHQVIFTAKWLKNLQQTPWLYNKKRQVFSPNLASPQDLAKAYTTVESHLLLAYIFEKENPDNRLSILSPEERLAIALGQRFMEEGFSEADLMSLKKWKARLAKRDKRSTEKSLPKIEVTTEQDEDEYNPAFMSSEELLQKREELRQRLEAELEEEIEALFKIEKLKAIIQNATRYSFEWFCALLDLEYILAFEKAEKEESITIYFENIEAEKGADKTIILKKPSRSIPINIEEMGDMTLRIQLEEERRILDVEVVSIRSTTLRAKLKTAAAIEDINFNKVRGGMLVIQNTIFTLEELIKSFKGLPFRATNNLLTRLPQNIQFIFGPPGTGKTTHLAQQEIMPLLLGEEALKILVLTPTNKAADVLCVKLLSILPEIPSSLMRFGISLDDTVESAGLLKDSTFDFSEVERCCVITTITRFPYDGFNNGNLDYQLKHIKWDVILFDEASMITLPSIVHVLYQQSKTQFIIAGDPFQIEPIVYVEEWKGENIYTLVNLQSFDPESQQVALRPHSFSILNLNTQYRSISTLGYLFSHLTYDGKLSHHRTPKDQRLLKLDGFPLQDINIIRFPVHQLETLFRPQKLLKSHYHIYAALLTVELVKYLVKEISKHHKTNEKPWRIGIICPYKAQATLVDKVLAGQRVGNKQVKVSCGTIHSFQGDECEIVLTALNPPRYISKSPNMFLNRKNIINVAISRASDYLFLLVPDEETEKIDNLYQLNRIKGIINYFVKGVTTIIKSMDVEEILFGQLDYIEQNTFATTHQKVNVYIQPEKQYEIRCEESAIDVQILKPD